MAISLEYATAEFRQETPAGLQELTAAVAADGRSGRASLRQGPLQLGAIIDPAAVLDAFGLATTDAHPDLPAQLVSTGLPSLVVPLRDVATLGRVRLDPGSVRAALSPIAPPDQLSCYFVTPLDAGTWRARSLALDIVGWD